MSQEHDFDTEIGYDMMRVDIDEDSDTAIPEEILKLVEEYDNRTTPNVEETETINLGNVEMSKEIRIGTHLTCYQKAELIELLRAYLDVFAWSYDEMPGLNTLIVEHRLPIDPAIRAIKQKLRDRKSVV